jgi:imidazolonepropionase-like amidohydrolase
VRQHLAEGADFIKVIASNEDLANPSHDGMTVPWMTESALREIVETAHLGHYMVCVHANGNETLRRCLAAGVDSIEHGIGLDKAQCAEMRERGIWLVPTLSQAKQAGDPEWGRPWWPRMRDMWRVCEQSIRIAVDQGVRMAAGTDVTGTMVEEVALLREAGMSPEDSLRAATINGAELMGLQNEIGTLAVGKAADVILVKGDPLASADALKSVRRIYRNGHRLDRDVIDALVPAHNLWPSGS